MDIIIEEWKQEDLPEMIRVWNEVVREGNAFPQEEELDIQTAREFFGSQSYCGVLKDGKTIKGLYILHPNNIGRCSHIANASYAVSAQERGKGLGEALVRHSLETARSLNFKSLQFNAVVKDNEPANRLYQRLGFEKIGSIEGGFRNKKGKYEDINIYIFYLNRL